MRPQPHAQQQIAVGPSADAATALAGEPDHLTVAHAGRDPDLDLAAAAERQAPPAAGRRLLERELELGATVPAALREPSAAGRAPATAEHALEEVAEDVVSEAAAEAGEAAAEAAAGALEPTRAGHVLAGSPVRAEPIVALALLRLAQHFVGLGDLLEAILRSRLLVHVRVVLAREPPVRAPDVLG